MQDEDHKMKRLLKGALSHPDRGKILGYLLGNAEETSTSELAGALGLDAAKVSYHLKVLRGADLVMQVEEEQGRGERAYLAAGLAGR
jgi:DNA-binding transcriptional ArsR family regulator